MAGLSGRSGSHLSVWRERDEETVTSSTRQEPSSGATIREARGPRSGPACMHMQRRQRACCVRNHRLAHHLPLSHPYSKGGYDACTHLHSDTQRWVILL